MNANRTSCALLFLGAFFWAITGLHAARMASASFLDVNGVYAYGSGYMTSPNYEQSVNVQEVAVSTQEAASFSQRSGKLSFYPFPASVYDLQPVIVSSHGISITWTAPSADIGRQAEAVENYSLRYTSSGFISTDEGFESAPSYAQTWTPLAPGSAEGRIVEGFNPGTTYYFSLETINSHGLRSELSNPAAAFALVPLSPMNFQLTRAGNSVTMTWVSPAGFQSRIPFNNRFSPSYPYEIKKYEVYRATAPADAEWAFIGETSSDTLTWTDILGADESFYYHARAVNQAGVSIPSYARASAGGGLYFLAPDNKSILEIPADATGDFFSASADPMDSYSIEISTHPEDLGGRVVKSVEFSAFRGGLQPATDFKLSKNGALKLYYAKSGGVISPSASTDEKTLSMYFNNGARWMQLYGDVNSAEHSVTLETRLLGRYQLRTTERGGSFSADKAGLTNRLITPNGDNKNDTMVFVFDNPQDKKVTGKIYDMRGALVGSMKAGPVGNSLIWDAKAGGLAVPGGVYIYQIEAEGTVYNGTVVVIR
ncbi:MAG: gliding motility-associated C-terminal domain-containing protein [Elusimicrobiales bacterium]|nr:gliding motility-associated C-terminal domain-containing protein [Elusimicrobiales bacterium]